MTPADAPFAELMRLSRTLLKRALELAQPDKDVDWGSLSDEQFQAAKRKLGIG